MIQFAIRRPVQVCSPLFVILCVVFLSCKKDPIPAPIAAFEINSGHQGEVIFVNNSEHGESYTWDFGDATTSTEENPVHTYLEAGSFTVRLTVTNESGFSVATETIFLNAPNAQFSIFRNDEVITLTNESEHATSYVWDFGDGNSSTEENPSHTYTQAGSYTITLTATGVGSDTHSQDVTFNAPVAAFDFNVDNGTVTFINQSQGATSYAWDFGDGNTSTKENPTHTYQEAKTYTVSLTANGSGSDIATEEVSLTGPNAQFNVSLDGATVRLTNTSSNATSYAWSFGDGNTSVEENPSHTYAQAGSYTITLTASGIGSDTYSVDLVLNLEYVVIPDANFEAQLIAKGIDSDGRVNQRMLSEDATDITTLDLTLAQGTPAEKKIMDLTGIESFKTLISLSAANNDLTSIDLSANTSLSSLELGLNSLEEIDLTTNTGLEILNLAGNSIRSIDVSKNINLIELDLSVNELSTITGLEVTTKLRDLNLSRNSLEELRVNLLSLEWLDLSTNLLNSLDVSGTTSLKYLQVKANSLKVLDISTSVALETFIASGNKIQDLNLGNNAGLELLWISNNELTSLDVSKLSKVHDLSIAGNPDLNCVKIAAGQIIATIRKEERQELREDCQQTAEEYITILDKNFERLLVQHLDDSDGLVNQKILKSDAEKITTLDLRQSATNANEADKIKDLSGIEGFVNLERLYLENNLLESIALNKNLKLRTLHLQGNLLTHLDVSANMLLSDANFSNNKLVSILLGGNTHYTNLFLQSNELKMLDVSLQTNLQFLFAENNKLESVKLSNTIKLLYLQNNLLTNLDVSGLSALNTLFVKENPGLYCIKVSDGQTIPVVSKNSHQELNTNCN